MAVLLLSSACATSSEESIDTWQAGPYYFVTVGVSKLVMMIPKDHLVPDPSRVGGSTESERYFKFASRDDSLIMSGWFENDRLFEGVEENWKQRTANARKLGLPQERDVQFSKLGKWDVISYEVEVPNVTSTHLVAHWVEAGTWIDLHLSTTSAAGTAAGNRAKLAAFLQEISVTEK